MKPTHVLFVFSLCTIGGYALGQHNYPVAAFAAWFAVPSVFDVVRRVRRADELESWVTRREEHTQ